MNLLRKGVPIVVSAPSGGGKTTLCHKLMEKLPQLAFSVSHTTRAPRGHEKAGVDYHFVTDAEFTRMIEAGEFLEWATVHGRKYGTSKAAVLAQLDAGVDVLFDIDVQGGRQILELMPEATLVFVVPPTMAVLRSRLVGRNSGDDIEARLSAAAEEIKAATFYTHWLLNDSLEKALAEMVAVVQAERLRRVDKAAMMARVLNG